MWIRPRSSAASAGWSSTAPWRAVCRQPQPPQPVHQHIGERGEVQPQLIGPHRRRAGPVGEQVQLLLLDPVFHLPAGAVDFSYRRLCTGLADRTGGHHEARVALVRQILRLAHHPPFDGPGLARLIAEVPERRAGRPVRSCSIACSPPSPRPGPDSAASFLASPSTIIHLVAFAPGHRFSRQNPRVAPDHDPHLRPARTDLRR